MRKCAGTSPDLVKVYPSLKSPPGEFLSPLKIKCPNRLGNFIHFGQFVASGVRSAPQQLEIQKTVIVYGNGVGANLKLGGHSLNR